MSDARRRRVQERIGRAVSLDPDSLDVKVVSSLRLAADQDLDAAWATIMRLQPWEFLAEMPAVQAIRLSMFRREPERMLDVARGLSQDYLDSHAFNGPIGFFKGIAHELAGRGVQAEVEWRAALELTEERLGNPPDDRMLLLWSVWLHAALKDTAGAVRRFAGSQALGGLEGDSMDTPRRGLPQLHLARRGGGSGVGGSLMGTYFTYSPTIC